MRAFFSLIAVGTLALGCRGGLAEPPQTAYLAFARSVERGEWKAAYDFLSAPSRSALEQRAKKLSDASGGAIGQDPISMTFGTGTRAPAINEIQVVDQTQYTAVISVSAGGKTQNQKLVLEEGRWKLDWTHMLQP